MVVVTPAGEVASSTALRTRRPISDVISPGTDTTSRSPIRSAMSGTAFGTFATSGSTAVSEAYFASMLGLPFVAVLPKSTAAEKIAAIEFHGGRCHFVATALEMYEAASSLAAKLGGHYMDQFTYAERATDWRGNNNIAESMFAQMTRERCPEPTWIVCGIWTWYLLRRLR